MKASEFRIGNKVYYLLEPGEKLVTTLDSEDINLMSKKESYLDIHEPIPLTHDILLNSGFEKHLLNYDHPKLGSLQFCPISANGEIRYLLVKSNGGDKLTTIKYVHQLQNLFWVMTGEELEVKL